MLLLRLQIGGKHICIHHLFTNSTLAKDTSCHDGKSIIPNRYSVWVETGPWIKLILRQADDWRAFHSFSLSLPLCPALSNNRVSHFMDSSTLENWSKLYSSSNLLMQATTSDAATVALETFLLPPPTTLHSGLSLCLGLVSFYERTRTTFKTTSCRDSIKFPCQTKGTRRLKGTWE